MSNSNIGRIRHKVLISYCPREFHTENSLQQASEGLCKVNFSAGRRFRTSVPQRNGAR
jgi:hypothetical protein